jgi:transcriptional regulator with XRE-family HTH domain
MDILRRAVANHGQSEVARRIGRSPSALSQVINGKYQGDPATILELVEAEFASTTVDCPELGDIPLATCIEEREKPFRATSSQRVRLYRACQVCRNKGGVK